MKNQNTIFCIIGAVILVAPIINSQISKETEMVGLNVHYYKDGVEVFPYKGLFSIVTPPGRSFDQISLDIAGTATGVPFSNIRIVDTTPTAFKNALPSTSKSLTIGESKTLWASSLIDTIQFESMIQPVRFRFNFSAINDYTKETVYGGDYVDLTIEKEQACIRGTDCEGDYKACDGSGNCLGWNGYGCDNCPNGVYVYSPYRATMYFCNWQGSRGALQGRMQVDWTSPPYWQAWSYSQISAECSYDNGKGTITNYYWQQKPY